MSATEVATAVQSRLSSQQLIELTNHSSAATTIDSTVLTAAASDAIGDFERVVGTPHDATNASHLAILCIGTHYFLELYKGRDTSLIKFRQNVFFGAMTNFRRLAAMEAASNSNLDYDRERAGTRPDMDRRRRVWGKKRTSAIVDTISTEE